METLLSAHGKTEEDLVFVSLDHYLEQIGQADSFEHEHREIDASLLKVKAARRLPEARRLLSAAVLASRNHFDHEERIAFPLAEKVLKRDTLVEMGQAWRRQRELAAGTTPKLSRRELFEGRVDSVSQGRDSHLQRKIRRRFKRVGESCLVHDQVKCFSPLRSRMRVEVGSNDSIFRRAVFNNFRGINRTNFCNFRDDSFGKRWTIFRVQLVNVKTVRLPIFVQAQAEIKLRLAFQPRAVRPDFGCFQMAIIAVQILAVGVLAPV